MTFALKVVWNIFMLCGAIAPILAGALLITRDAQVDAYFGTVDAMSRLSESEAEQMFAELDILIQHASAPSASDAYAGFVNSASADASGGAR